MPRHKRLAVISLSPSLKATLVKVKNVKGNSKRVKGDYTTKKRKVAHFFNQILTSINCLLAFRNY
jgi:translation initiation factor IF-3